MFSSSIYKKTMHFFDKFEDVVRGWISKRPVLFGLVGGLAVVEFWRGVWHLTDFLSEAVGLDPYGFASGMFSAVLGTVIMLSTGLYVSLFVGDSIILSGIKKEKKFFEKTADEMKEEDDRLKKIHSILMKLEDGQNELKTRLEKQQIENEARMEKLESKPVRVKKVILHD